MLSSTMVEAYFGIDHLIKEAKTILCVSKDRYTALPLKYIHPS